MAGFFEIVAGMAKAALGVPNPWEHSIRRFERLDGRVVQNPASIVFLGSSSFTLWSSLERDMSPLHVVNRGFGGALVDDVIRHTGRILAGRTPAAVVVFVGTNDISGSHPATPDFLEERFGELVSTIRSASPGGLIFYVAITPSRARWDLWPIANEVNRRIAARIAADDGLRFIDLGPLLLADNGLPDSSLYRSDRLHPNKAGYAVWARAIHSALLGEPSLAAAPGLSDQPAYPADSARD